ncbi:MAG: hypothetical protein NZ941_08390, partial [Candidatus Caldarchaeum sp.]|nr:hypothetical protein [Candidatus Caldarchaeum sp.]
SFELTEPTPLHISTGFVVAEVVDDYKGETKLVWGLSETNTVYVKDGVKFVHKRLWKELGAWEKGQPKTVWYKKPVPVRFTTALSLRSGNPLLHTFRDTDGGYVYVFEASPNTAEWWVLYL